MTTNQIAKLLGVEPGVAYGLLRYLVEKGYITASSAPKVEGKRGRRAVLYQPLNLKLEDFVADMKMLMNEQTKEIDECINSLPPIVCEAPNVSNEG